MRPHNHLLLCGSLFFCAVAHSAHGQHADKGGGEEGPQLTKLLKEAKKAKAYRPLSAREIKEAMALPILNQRTAVFLVNPGFKPGAQLPSGATLKRDGYYFMVVVGKITYSFLQAQTPPGNEVLFICDHGLPWWGWIAAPGVCGSAILRAPDRTAQLEAYSKLTAFDRGTGDEYRSTPAGRAYLTKLRPHFELILRHCAKSAPSEERRYAWMGRISGSGKIVRTGVAADSAPYVATSPYFDCINEQARKEAAPFPPRSDGDIMWSGGWPVEFEWKHYNSTDVLIKW